MQFRGPAGGSSSAMSLNRYEQTIYDYWERQPDELRHWRAKALWAAQSAGVNASRGLERELWDYFVERSQHVPQLRELNQGGVRRVSLQNLAELILRLWGPVTKPKPRPPAD
jgi:hypothetical protein